MSSPAEAKRAYMRAYRQGVRRPRVLVHPLVRLERMVDRWSAPLPFDASLGRCWEWLGARNSAGYGVLKLPGGRLVLAHRLSLALALEVHGRSLDHSLVVRHRCDNQLCVRPQHLVQGTQAENVADMIARGRATWQVRPPRPFDLEATA